MKALITTIALATTLAAGTAAAGSSIETGAVLNQKERATTYVSSQGSHNGTTDLYINYGTDAFVGSN